jgi:hypothetical protein
METQIQALLARVGDLEAESKALQTFHATHDAEASGDGVEKDEFAGNSAQVRVDPNTDTLLVSAAKGQTVRVAPVLQLGKYTDVEQTLNRHIAGQAYCTAKLESLEAEMAALARRVNSLIGE